MPKNSRELKNEILKSLNDWCLDPLGDLVDAKALMNRTYHDINSYWFRYLKDDEANPNWRTEPKTDDFILSPEDYQEVKEAMIKKITQTPQDWKIEQEGDLTVIKHKSGWKHWKSEFLKGSKKGFSGDEWTEIKNALNKSKQADFTSNPNKERQNNYDNLTKEQLITEINRLKTEIESLKNNQTLTTSERQARLQQNQEKLEQLKLKNIVKYGNSNTQNLEKNNSNNNFPTGWVVGGVIFVVAGGLIMWFIAKSKKKK